MNFQSQRQNKIFSLIICLAVIFAPVMNWAAIPSPFSNFLKVSKNHGSKELNLERVAHLHKTLRREAKVDLSQYIPLNMGATNDQEMVATKIVTHGLNTWLTSEEVRKTTTGKAVNSIGKVLNPDMKVGKHSFKLRIDAGTSVAALNYSGLINASLTMQTETNVMDLSVSQKIAGKTWVLNHKEVPQGSTDSVSLSWSW